MSVSNVLKRHRKPIEKPQEGNHVPSELLVSLYVLKERTLTTEEGLEENNTTTSAKLISQWLKATDLSSKFKSFLSKRCYLWGIGESYLAMIAGERVTKSFGTPCQICWDTSQVYSPASVLWLVFASLPKPISYQSSQGWNDSSHLWHAHLYSSYADVVNEQVCLCSGCYCRKMTCLKGL